MRHGASCPSSTAAILRSCSFTSPSPAPDRGASMPCAKSENRNSPSAAKRCRIDLDTECCRERRAAQARAQAERIVAWVAHAARDGAEIAGEHVAILFRKVRVGVIEAELEHPVAERQAGAPIRERRQRKPAACRADAAAARGWAEGPAAEIEGEGPAHLGRKEPARQFI